MNIEKREIDYIDETDTDDTEKRSVVKPVQLEEYQQQSKAVQKTKKTNWIDFGIRAGFTVALFTFLARSVSWSMVFVTLVHVDVAPLLVGLTVGAYGNVVSCYQWGSLLRSERINVDLAKLINLYLVGIAFSHFLPTGMGGDAVKAFYVGRESGNSGGSVSSVVMSRVTGFFGMLLIALPALLIWQKHFSHLVVIWFLLLSMVVGTMIVVAIFSATWLSKILKGSWAKYHIFALIIAIGRALGARVRQPRSLLIPILFGIMFWIISFLNYYSYAIALGMHVPLYFYFIAIPVVSLIAFLPISINGFGIREGAFVLVFSTIHVPVATSLLLALLMDVQVLLFGVIGACMYLTMSTKANATKQQHIV